MTSWTAEEKRDLIELVRHLVRYRQAKKCERTGMFGLGRTPGISYLFLPYSELPDPPFEEQPHLRPQVFSTYIALRALRSAEKTEDLLSEPDLKEIEDSCQLAATWLQTLFKAIGPGSQRKEVFVDIEKKSKPPQQSDGKQVRVFERVASHYHTALAFYTLAELSGATNYDIREFRAFAEACEDEQNWSTAGFRPYEQDDHLLEQDAQNIGTWTPWSTVYQFLFLSKFKRLVPMPGEASKREVSRRWILDYADKACEKLSHRQIAQHVVRSLLEMVTEVSPREVPLVEKLVELWHALREKLHPDEEWDESNYVNKNKDNRWEEVVEALEAYGPLTEELAKWELSLPRLLGFEYRLTCWALYWFLANMSLDVAEEAIGKPPEEIVNCSRHAVGILRALDSDYDCAGKALTDLVHWQKQYGYDVFDVYDISYLLLLRLSVISFLTKKERVIKAAKARLDERIEEAQKITVSEAYKWKRCWGPNQGDPAAFGRLRALVAEEERTIRNLQNQSTRATKPNQIASFVEALAAMLSDHSTTWEKHLALEEKVDDLAPPPSNQK